MTELGITGMTFQLLGFNVNILGIAPHGFGDF
jgi:hypothetical protein